MPQLTVRSVDDAIAAALKARDGRSAEAEHRRILEEALCTRADTDVFALARTSVWTPACRPRAISCARAGTGTRLIPARPAWWWMLRSR